MTLKVGDRVKISPSSEYYDSGMYNPKDVEGTVTTLHDKEKREHFVWVTWDDTKFENHYRDYDLIKLSSTEELPSESAKEHDMFDTKALDAALKSLTADREREEKDKLKTEVTVVRTGTQIILPGDPRPMSYDEAIAALEKRKKEENTKVAVNEIIKVFPFDGAYAFMKAMQRMYGWATPAPTPSFFGPRPPQTLSLEVDYGKTVQIIWGRFEIPTIKGFLNSGVWQDDSGMTFFCIQGEVLKMHMDEIKQLADLTRQIAAEESIYRGKAIRLECDEEGDVDFNQAPKFLDISRVNEEELTYSEEVMTQIRTNLFTLVEHTDVCRANRIPLKRGVLLQGKYGTGKTLAAFVTAKKCVANGWTFVLLDKVSGLKDALTFARLYGPAVVFAEDIDRAVTGERSVEMDDILNTIDGIESKGSEVITILTSNHVENINKAMIRPGRLDAVIHVAAPDAKACEKLIRIYSRGTLDQSEDLTAAGVELEGQIPAVIREVVERSKLYSISRNPSAAKVTITAEDVVHSARGMRAHLDLMETKAPERTEAEVFYDSFKNMVAGTTANVENVLHRVKSQVGEIHDRVLN